MGSNGWLIELFDGLSEVFDKAATALHEQDSEEEEPEPEPEPEEKPKPRRRSRKT